MRRSFSDPSHGQKTPALDIWQKATGFVQTQARAYAAHLILLNFWNNIAPKTWQCSATALSAACPPRSMFLANAP